MLEQIPEEMKAYNQFVMYKLETLEDGRTTKIPYCPQNGRKASPTNPADWSSYAFAEQMLECTDCYSGIGFVLTENDPFVFIDLDNPYALDQDGQPKYPNAAEIMARQIEMFEGFQTYIERSPSGQGLHMIGYGSVPGGRKRDAIEVYSTARYMTMTGDVMKALPISDINEWANSLWAFLAPAKPAFSNATVIESQPEIHTDNEICEMAYAAKDGPKFLDLYSGRWNQHYESQSSADFALINILAFYTDSKEQVHRIFMSSALGQRPKAKRPDYMRAMLDRSFDRKIPQIDFSALKAQYESQARKPVEKVENTLKNPYTFPTGLLGDVAQFIFEQSPHPAKEISLAGALSFMAGMCGRAYNVRGMGLNNYFLLLAKTGRGKEAMSSGISKIFSAVAETTPSVLEFKGPARIASAQALHKQLKKTPCFSSIFGEFDTLVKRITSDRAAPGDRDFHASLLDLFGKSAKGNSLSGIIYSDSDKNVEDIKSPAFSFLGECTPNEYYLVANERLLTSGFLPRITTIEFLGDCAPLNKANADAKPSAELIRGVADLACYNLQLGSEKSVIDITIDPGAEELLDEYSEKCRLYKNKNDGVACSIWSRSYVKVVKLAGLVAIGITPYFPVITKDCLEWAMNIVNYDNNNLISKFENNEIGTNNSDSDQIKAFKKTCDRYLKSDFKDLPKQRGTEQMHKAKVTAYSYLQVTLNNHACFKNDKLGATNSFKKTLQTMIDSGFLQEIAPVQAKTQFQFTGKCYAIMGEI